MGVANYCVGIAILVSFVINLFVVCVFGMVCNNYLQLLITIDNRVCIRIAMVLI